MAPELIPKSRWNTFKSVIVERGRIDDAGLEITGIWYKRVKHFNLAGHIHFLTFSCYRRMPLLAHDLWCSWLAESISRSLEKHNVALWAYVFMPDHVHLLVRPRSDIYDISDFLRSMKISSAKRILNSFREQHSPILDKLQTQGIGADSLPLLASRTWL